MDGIKAQQKVWLGYGKAASKIGLVYKVYRSINGINPITAPNYLYEVFLSTTQAWSYKNPNKFSMNSWLMVVDGTKVSPGDYLVANNSLTNDIYYIASKQHLQPILGIKCDRTIDVIAVTDTGFETNKGFTGYAAEDLPPKSNQIIMQACPASFIIGSKGESSSVNIPFDTKMPWYSVYLPYLNKHIESGYVLVDDKSKRFLLSGNQKTDNGWKLIATTLGA